MKTTAKHFGLAVEP